MLRKKSRSFCINQVPDKEEKTEGVQLQVSDKFPQTTKQEKQESLEDCKSNPSGQNNLPITSNLKKMPCPKIVISSIEFASESEEQSQTKEKLEDTPKTDNTDNEPTPKFLQISDKHIDIDPVMKKEAKPLMFGDFNERHIEKKKEIEQRLKTQKEIEVNSMEKHPCAISSRVKTVPRSSFYFSSLEVRIVRENPNQLLIPENNKIIDSEGDKP
jgi:hypothetical protein